MSSEIKKVGVIGSGQMGNGIAHVAALAGFDVVLYDVSSDRLKSGMATINGNLSRQVSKKIITEDAHKKALSRIEAKESIEGLADCDLAIETAVEKEEVKRKIFHDVCAVLKPEAIVGSNTSSISITRLAASTDRPERFIGIHFMSACTEPSMVCAGPNQRIIFSASVHAAKTFAGEALSRRVMVRLGWVSTVPPPRMLRDDRAVRSRNAGSD